MESLIVFPGIAFSETSTMVYLTTMLMLIIGRNFRASMPAARWTKNFGVMGEEEEEERRSHMIYPTVITSPAACQKLE